MEKVQYKYDHEMDILLKSNDGRNWYFFMNKNDETPKYTDYEKKLLERERELYQEAQDRWTQAMIEMQDDPEYWENQINYFEEFKTDENEEEESMICEKLEESTVFPINALPYGIKELVKEGHEAFDVGHEFFALPSLVACATAIGSKFEVAINKSMTTKPIIYACLIAMPGSGKSPAQNIAMKPLKKIQKQALDNYKKNLDQYHKDMKDYETKEKQAKKDGKEFNEEQPFKPKLQEFYTTNSTIEAIAKILQKSPQGIAYINDEFLGFYNSLNSYRSGKGSDLQEWLSLWNGNEMKIDRKGDDIPLTVNDPYVSIVGNMTPSGIKQISGDSNTENGFLDRFLFSFPTDTKPFDPAKANGISKEVEDTYFNLIKSLIEMESNEDKKYISLSEDALNTYKEYFKKTNEIAGDDEKLRSIVAKLQMYSVRFGLIIHLCEQQDKSNFVKHTAIQKDSMEKAIQLCEYFRSQVDKIYDKIATSESDEMVERAIKLIKKKAAKVGKEYVISRRDIQRGIKGMKAEQMDILSEDLIERGVLTIKEEGKRGSITYYVCQEILN